MSLTGITLNDRIRLSQLRNKRLRSFFAQSLSNCVFHRTHHNMLIIHCPEAWMMDSILADLEEFCDYAWLILGVEAIALYFAQEEICRVEHDGVHRASSGIRRHGVLKKISQRVVLLE